MMKINTFRMSGYILEVHRLHRYIIGDNYNDLILYISPGQKDRLG